MRVQGYDEPVGGAKITQGYNLPAKHVLHTVGPVIETEVTEEKRRMLESCYVSCMELAEAYQLKSIAFCCISTGVFRFPNRLAAEIAVQAVWVIQGFKKWCLMYLRIWISISMRICWDERSDIQLPGFS